MSCFKGDIEFGIYIVVVEVVVKESGFYEVLVFVCDIESVVVFFWISREVF